MSTQWEIDLIINIWLLVSSWTYHALFIPALPLKVKLVAKYVSYNIDVSCDIGYRCLH